MDINTRESRQYLDRKVEQDGDGWLPTPPAPVSSLDVAFVPSSEEQQQKTGLSLQASVRGSRVGWGERRLRIPHC
jgi:hypothetical protein